MLVVLCKISTHGTSFMRPTTVSLLNSVVKFKHINIPLNKLTTNYLKYLASYIMTLLCNACRLIIFN